MQKPPQRLPHVARSAALAAALAAAAAVVAAPAVPAIGSFGFDVAGMDRSVAPGDDFNAYANGGWIARTAIPPDRSGYDGFTAIEERAERETRAILEAAAAAPAATARPAAGAVAGASRQGTANDTSTGDTRKIGGLYAAFMDEAGIEARGLAPLRPELDGIAAIADRAGLARALGATLRADVDLLNMTDFYTDRLFGLWVTQDLRNPDRVMPYLVQGGLGMPDRDFYLGEGRMQALKSKYQAHVAKLCELADDPGALAAAKAARIVALETAIARVHATQLETNDVEKGGNGWSRADFANRAPGLDWNAFFAAAGLAAQQEFIVWQPAAVTGIAALVASEPLETWKEYLAVHALDRASPYLPRAFADERFAFYGTVLSGTPQQRERWKRAVSAANGALGEAIGRVYVAKHFSPATKARADELVANLVAAFGKRIDAIDWMTPATKARARAKLAGLRIGMGYPSRWRDYSALEIRRDDALGNAQRASLFEYRRNLAKLGKPVDHEEWFLLPQEVNALNLPLENRLIFPAAILQPPFFDAAADDAVNYGSIGAVIGHEISHSFDDKGALFDESGRLANWWTPEDFKRFNAAGSALAAQFSAYRPFPDLAVNGELTLGENIADVAGLATAFDAWKLSQQGRVPRVLEGFSPAQRFFLGYAQSWRGKLREPALRTRVLTDVHAPGEFRTQTVRNLDAWYAAFNVKPGQRLYLPRQQRIAVW
jgi:putative endopeptidase